VIINGAALLDAAPIKDMADGKMVGPGGTSFGLGEAGYDIRIKQNIHFSSVNEKRVIYLDVYDELGQITDAAEVLTGRFALASAIEPFQMPDDLVGIVHDKSTWARRGLSVFNTVIEPGWKGFLTLELVYHGQDELVIPAGSGIAQVVFHRTSQAAHYTGKYQDQADEPVKAINS
jgi:dCTP deaminase